MSLRSGIVALVLGATVVVATAAPAVAAPRPAEAVDRVLVVSLPSISWDEIEDHRVPNLRKLLAASALGNLTTRTITRSDLASGYVTLGSGTRGRGSGSPSDGAALGVDEDFGGVAAGDVFASRTGRSVDRGVVHLGIAQIEVANEAELVSVLPGALGAELRDAGLRGVVLANADHIAPDTGSLVYRRDAVAALMRPNGTLTAGVVGDELVERHGASPFGVRADLDAFAEGFRDGWKKGSVVLVEASDLIRATEFAAFATPQQRQRVYRRALERFDGLLGRMLQEVDNERDAVLVTSPTPSSDDKLLTIAALRAPDVVPGYLRSSSTRRAGYVLLADVAPTIVDLLGRPRVPEMKGRPFAVDARGASLDERIDDLRTGVDAAVFRDRVREGVTVAFIVVQSLLALGAVLVITRGASRSRRAALRRAGLCAMGFVPAIFLARLLPFHDAGLLPYSLFLFGVAVALGLLYDLIGRGRAVDSLIAATAAICALLVVDVATGAQLQLSSSFGYSPTIGVRVAGFGNIAYSLLTASALVLAGLIAFRVEGVWGRRSALALLAVVLVVDVAPFLGSDVGGILSLVPAFGVFAFVMLGIRLGHPVRVAVLGFAAAVLATGAVAAFDLSRPDDQRTHLGRLVEDVRANGTTELTDTLARKLEQNIETLTSSSWRFLVLIVLAFLAFLWFGRSRALSGLLRAIPPMRATLLGIGIAAVLGYALNDSGITIPGVMLGVLNACLVVLLMDRNDQRAEKPAYPLVETGVPL